MDLNTTSKLQWQLSSESAIRRPLKSKLVKLDSMMSINSVMAKVVCIGRREALSMI